MKLAIWATLAASIGAVPLGWGVNLLAQAGYATEAAMAWIGGAIAITALVSFIALTVGQQD
jgi:hypothetical protein